MTSVIVVSALGVIVIICGGLFLRRLFGEITELRRQITRFDRQMRAQRAHVTFLRQLIAEDDRDDEEGEYPLSEVAVVNGGLAGPPPGAAPAGPEPVRRKGHLGLHIGGAVAAMAAIATAAREALRHHRGQLIGTLTGAAVTAATVTMVTVQPWSDNANHQPPSSAPTAASSPGYTPPPGPYPTEPPPEPGISDSPSASPGKSAPPGPQPTQSLALVGEELPAVDRTSPGSRGRGHRPTAPPGRVTPPGATHTPSPRAKPPGQGGAPPGQTHRPSPPPTPPGHKTCADVTAAPLATVEACFI